MGKRKRQGDEEEETIPPAKEGQCHYWVSAALLKRKLTALGKEYPTIPTIHRSSENDDIAILASSQEINTVGNMLY